MITRMRPAGVLVGYAVQAVDGLVGTIDRGTYDRGRLVVMAVTGEPVTLPVDAVQRIDHPGRTVYLGVPRASVKA
ncbi:hypothetical protein [Dactylosporangium sp. NPDC005555]|uniref:hypothetical protein n=1 Tax=Dactylosporangium sp. NPDC005555 TaxID=3154889 RepID=UPI0033A89BFC